LKYSHHRRLNEVHKRSIEYHLDIVKIVMIVD